MRARLVWGLLLVSAGCALNPAPVPVAGAAVDVGALRGEWLGEYRSAETGRSGSIYFKLEAGRDTAVGDVVMAPTRMTNVPNDPLAPAPPEWLKGSQVLTIRFVRVEGTLLEGRMEEYPSPDCDHLLLTLFKGELRGDRINGTFTTYHGQGDGATQRGTWWATRQRAQ